MKVSSALFIVSHKKQCYFVTFAGDKATVRLGGHNKILLEFDNSDRLLKPCATHSLNLVRIAVGEASKTEQEKSRRRFIEQRVQKAEGFHGEYNSWGDGTWTGTNGTLRVFQGEED